MTGPSPLRAVAQAHADAGPTERAARTRAAIRAGSLRGRALVAIAEAGDRGLTIEEAMRVLGIPERRRYGLAPRLSELVHDGYATASRELVRGRSMAYVATAEGDAWARRLNAAA